MDSEPQIPFDGEAEQALLSILLVQGQRFEEVSSIVSQSDFYRKVHGLIFQAIASLVEQAAPIDVVTVSQELKKRGNLEDVGGRQYVTDLSLSFSSGSSLIWHADNLRELSTRRRLLRLSYDISSAIDGGEVTAKEVISSAAERLESLDKETKAEPGPRTFAQVSNRLFEIAEYRDAHRGMLSGLPTGFADFDEITGGFENGHLIIFGGRTGMGKTAFAGSMIINMCKIYQAKIGLFSLEMTTEQVMSRIISSISTVPSRYVDRGLMDGTDWGRFAAGLSAANDMQVQSVDEGCRSVADIKKHYKKMCKIWEPDALVIDHIQLLHDDSCKDRMDELTKVTWELKQFAREIQKPIIALCQLSRAVTDRKNKRPVLTDLKESGSIEENADVVFFIHREEYYDNGPERKGEADLIVAKNRFGETGDAVLLYQKSISRFLAKRDALDALKWAPPAKTTHSARSIDALAMETKSWTTIENDGNVFLRPLGGGNIRQVWSTRACEAKMLEVAKRSPEQQADFWRQIEESVNKQTSAMNEEWMRMNIAALKRAEAKMPSQMNIALNAIDIFSAWE